MTIVSPLQPDQAMGLPGTRQPRRSTDRPSPADLFSIFDENRKLVPHQGQAAHTFRTPDPRPRIPHPFWWDVTRSMSTPAIGPLATRGICRDNPAMRIFNGAIQ
jgi:hypothetical protein